MMKTISITPNPSGAYPAPQNRSGAGLPKGDVYIPAAIDLTDFYAHNGFVTLTIEDDFVTDYQVNTKAWKAWKKTLLPKPVIEEALPETEAEE